MGKRLRSALILSAVVFALPTLAQAASELHVTSKGDLTASDLVVIQKVGTTFFTRAQWEDSYVRISVQTSPSTIVTKNYGEQATVADITDGHAIDVEGTLMSGSETLTIVAKKIRDKALVKESKAVSGTVKSVDMVTQSFVVTDKKLGDVTVLASVPIQQGKRTVPLASLKKGDKAISVTGAYDFSSKVLSPLSIEIYQSKDIFKARNFQGTIKGISGTSLPTQIVVAAEGVEYTVYLSEKTLVVNKNRVPTGLRRFAEGDTVRFYGAIRETNLAEVDAEVVRDLNF